MTLIVVDASVALKWFLAENNSELARRLLHRSYECVAPEFAFFEVTHGLLKRRRRGLIDSTEVMQSVADLLAIMDARDTVHLAAQASEIAIKYDRSAYDAGYVVLAIEHDCPFVTADRRLYDALVPHFPDTMRWIEDIQEAEST